MGTVIITEDGAYVFSDREPVDALAHFLENWCPHYSGPLQIVPILGTSIACRKETTKTLDKF